MGKFNSKSNNFKVEQLESRTVSWNGLCSKFEVPLYYVLFSLFTLRSCQYVEDIALNGGRINGELQGIWKKAVVA
jgi:hypothetical protein